MSDFAYGSAKISSGLLSLAALICSIYLACARLTQNHYSWHWLGAFVLGLVVLWIALELGNAGDSDSDPHPMATISAILCGLALFVVANCFLYATFDWSGFITVWSVIGFAGLCTLCA